VNHVTPGDSFVTLTGIDETNFAEYILITTN
jgi:hypothetical protein